MQVCIVIVTRSARLSKVEVKSGIRFDGQIAVTIAVIRSDEGKYRHVKFSIRVVS